MQERTQPAAGLSFDTGAVTHVGKVRKANEDHYLVRPEIGVWAVADGMGGHVNGALASATVVEELESIGPAASAPDLLARLEDRVIHANARLRDIARENGASVIGSTLVVLLVHHAHFACVWSGDSRIYLVREGRIVQVSRDHTEAQDMIEKGLLTPDEARRWPRRHVITRAIGVHETPELELDNGEIQPGDTFILCSDGLTGHVRDHEILAAVHGRAPQAACDLLLQTTLDRGASDNVTVVIVRYQPQATVLNPSTHGLSRRSPS